MLLRRIELAPGMVRLVEATLLDIWNDLRSAALQETVTVRRRIADLEHRKKRYTEAYVVEQAIDRATYQREVAARSAAAPAKYLEVSWIEALPITGIDPLLPIQQPVNLKFHLVCQIESLQLDGLPLVGEAALRLISALNFPLHSLCPAANPSFLIRLLIQVHVVPPKVQRRMLDDVPSQDRDHRQSVEAL